MSPALNLDLGKQKLDGLRRESIKRLQMRSKTRLVHTRGPSRWRINMDCGRPMKSLQTSAQRRNGEALALCKHLIRFNREEDMKSRGDRVDKRCGLKKDQDR